nr:Ig-like domain-containing protein [Gemmatimonadaceae bacterium]
MRRNRLAMVALLCAAACGGGGGDGATPPAPLTIATLVKVTPDPVQPLPGARVAVQVSARAANGAGVGGALLTANVSFNGAVTPASVATDPNGLAEFAWFLAPTAGANTLTITSANGVAATFTTTSVPPAAASMIKVTPDQGPLNAGSSLRVRVATLDAGGQRLGGVAVTFATTGGGTATPASATSDATGEASTLWTFGASPSANTLVVRTANNLQVTYAVQTVAPQPVTLVTVGTPPTSAVVRSAIPVTVEARDSAGRGMRGIPITFSASAPTTVAPATVSTDSLGRATATMTLGVVPSVNTIEARTPNGLSARTTVQGTLGPP